MPETEINITLDSTSTFDSLVPLRDQMAAAEACTLTGELADDIPSAVLFGLGQMLCAAVRDGKVKSDAIAPFKDVAPFGAMLATTGFDNALAQAA